MTLTEFAELAQVVALLDSHNAEQQCRALETLRRQGVVWADLCWQLVDVLTTPEESKPQPEPKPAKPKVKAKPKRKPQQIAPLAKAPQRRRIINVHDAILASCKPEE